MIHELPERSTIVLIPAYEPAEALVTATRQLISAGLTVVVVDDGSGSDYSSVFGQLHDSVKLIQYPVNKGKGSALKTGLRYIRDNYHEYVVVTADSDGQHHVADIQKMAREYDFHSGSLYLGSRTFENKNVPLRSRFGNTITRKLFALLTRRRLRDTQTGLRAFDDCLIGFMINIPGERFEYEMNVLLACARREVPIVEVPIATIYENENAGSHFQTIRDSWLVYKEVIKFASSSLIAFGIDFGMFILLLHVTSSWQLAGSVTIANITARIISASCNFALNRQLVFKHKANLFKEILNYAALAAVILVTNTLLLNLLTQYVHIHPYIAKAITEISLFTISYTVQKYVIFAKKFRYPV